MLRVTFRTKLLLAMMLVVAGVTLVALLVTQRRVQANYERMFRTQYERQVGYFTALQEARLGSIKEQCLTLARSVRLLALMREDEANAALLYDLADGELRSVLRELPDDGRPAAGRSGRSSTAGFFRFVAADGSVIPEPETGAGRRLLPPALKRRLEQRLGFVREVFQSGEIQNVAYLPVVVRTNQPAAPRPGGLRARPSQPERSDAGESPTLQEIIVTRIVDPTDGKNLGALVLGFALPDLVPQAKHTGNAAGTNPVEIIQAGILIEDRLFADTETITGAVGEMVAEKIVQRIKAGERVQADFSTVIGGTPHRIFYEILNENSKFPAAYQVCLYSMAEAQAEQSALRWRVAGLGAGALLVALALSLFISHGLTAPIRDLVGGTGEIRRGNFSVRVPVRSRDEVGQLTASFNEMAEGLAQKEKYRTVLNMVADEKVAAQLVAGELTLGGELREISVVFCDIRGFTALTQNMPPGEVIEMINEHMTALTGVVKEHHGVLDKFVGDLLMAIFGAPLHHGDDALNAARCALRLQEVRAALNQTSRHRLQIGIGLATGTMVAGCMGSIDRLNYTVLGERVNLASRLCSRAAAGEVLIDENTRQQLGEKIQVEPTGDIELKGFAGPVAAFRLIEVKG